MLFLNVNGLYRVISRFINDYFHWEFFALLLLGI